MPALLAAVALVAGVAGATYAVAADDAASDSDWQSWQANANDTRPGLDAAWGARFRGVLPRLPLAEV